MASHADGRFIGPRRHLEILSSDDVTRIHEASLEVLAETGVMFYSQRALDALEAHGAIVDRATTVARIPRETVEQALATLPSTMILGGRTPEFDLPVDGAHAYLSSDGCAPFVRTLDGEVRRSRKQDVHEAARVVDAMPNLSLTSAIVSAQDCPEETRVLHEFDACIRASRKHTVAVSMKDATEAAPLIRMAEAVAGGSAELKARPLFSVILGTVAPLHQERFGMDLAFALGAAGIPVFLYPMPIIGATAPVTPAGTAVVNNTELLAAVTAIQLACPGAPLIHAGGPAALDMRSGGYFANVPEALLLRAAQGHMARFYGMPAGLGWGGTKAMTPDAQAAYENTSGLLLAFLAGADLLFGAGLLDSVQQLSLQELVIADEVFGIVTRLLKGVAVDRESLAVDLIKRMGFNGDYLFDGHTRAHVRELWRGRLGEIGTLESWQAAGAPSLEAKAAETVREILASSPDEFPEDLGREMGQIIEAAQVGAL